MIADRRKSKRFRMQGDYFFYPGNSENKFLCKVKNISITGSCIVSDSNIKKDEIIYLHVGAQKSIELKSRVIWKSDKQYGLLFMLETGTDFDNISYIINYESSRINK